MDSTSDYDKNLEFRCDSLEPLLFVVDRSGHVLSMSLSVIRLCRYKEEEIRGCAFRSFLLDLNPAWDHLLPAAVIDFVKQGIFLPWRREPTQGLGWNVTAIPVGPDKGDPISISFIPGFAPEVVIRASEDGITEDVLGALHNVHMRAQQSETRFRRLLKLLPGISLIQNHDLDFSWRGSELKMLLGAEVYELLETELWTKWIHPADQPDFYNSVERCKTGHHPVSSRLRICLPNERVIHLLDIRFPVIGVDGSVNGYEVLWIDLSRQRIAEKRLHESAWKESLSEISGSLTHDFNNIMAGIINLSNLMRGPEDQKTVTVDRSNIELIWKSAQHAQSLLQQVVSLNKNKLGKVELFDLKQFVEEQHDILRIILPQRILLEKNLPDQELPVRLDKVALLRTILNFATNARDAIKGKGRAVISLKVVDLATYSREDIFSALSPRRGRAVELSFKDDGCGISDEHINQIFCPYFSTKREKSGIGLGLSSIYRNAEENGFDFGVRSKPGEGSEMLLLLPMDDTDTDPQAQEESPEPKAFIPAHDEDLLIYIYGADSKHVSFMESKFVQDYGAQVRTKSSLRDLLHWLYRDRQDEAVLILVFDRYNNIPEEIREALQFNFGKLYRIVILTDEDPRNLMLDADPSACFDVALKAGSNPASDCQRVLRSFGHKSLFTIQDFSS